MHCTWLFLLIYESNIISLSITSFLCVSLYLRACSYTYILDCAVINLVK